MTINELTRRFGTEGARALTRLETLMRTSGIQYMEAITMPGSQGQMHVGTQEVAASMLNPDMSVEQILGTIDAWNLEITQTRGALRGISEELIQRVVAKENALRKAGVVERYRDPVTGELGEVIDNSKPYEITATWQQRLDDTTNTPSQNATPAQLEHGGKTIPWSEIQSRHQ
jgi:hypothetical protein